MDDLIKALGIFRKYKNSHRPTMCEHDVLMVMDVTEEEVSDEDKVILSSLSFEWSEEYDCWTSDRFGSA